MVRKAYINLVYPRTSFALHRYEIVQMALSSMRLNFKIFVILHDFFTIVFDFNFQRINKICNNLSGVIEYLFTIFI